MSRTNDISSDKISAVIISTPKAVDSARRGRKDVSGRNRYGTAFGEETIGTLRTRT